MKQKKGERNNFNMHFEIGIGITLIDAFNSLNFELNDYFEYKRQ